MKPRLAARAILSILVCIVLLIGVAAAHPGRTDSNGGHYDRSTSEYHYHHGYSAHQHPNGVCPYDFDDKTGQNSGSNSDSSSSSSAKSGNKQQSAETEAAEEEKTTVLDVITFGFLILFILFVAVSIIAPVVVVITGIVFPFFKDLIKKR